MLIPIAYTAYQVRSVYEIDIITGFCGQLHLLTQDQLTDQSLYSLKPQQPVKQRMQFANHNRANYHKSW